MVREANEANGSRTGIEKSHHLTATLYFSIAALEAFLNEKMRKKLKSEGADEDEVGARGHVRSRGQAGDPDWKPFGRPVRGRRGGYDSAAACCREQRPAGANRKPRIA